jgi:hypothetical protein
MDGLSKAARSVAALLEPVAGQVYFAPECHAGYEALGFGGSPGRFAGVAGPNGPAYFTSRGSLLGQVPGEVVAAAFAVFSPAAVVPAVTHGWTLTDAGTIRAARDHGAIAQLRRVLGDRPDGLERATELLAAAVAPLRPEGRPLFAGLRARGLPTDPLGAMWRLADSLREYRGDSHTAAWVSAGFDATEIGLLSELYWGLPMRSYSRTRAWTDTEFDRAERRLIDRGLVADGALTDAGRAAREAVEVATDLQLAAAIAAIGADGVDELRRILGPWGAALRAAGAYPAAGPHDLAAAAGGTALGEPEP